MYIHAETFHFAFTGDVGHPGTLEMCALCFIFTAAPDMTNDVLKKVQFMEIQLMNRLNTGSGILILLYFLLII